MTERIALARFHALIPCAGTGSRAGTAQPKQYQQVAGQPMVMHTVQALAQVPQLARAFQAGGLRWREPRRERFQWPEGHAGSRP